MEGLLKLFLKRNFFNSKKDFFEIFLKEIFFCLLKIKKCIDISSIQFEITNFGGDDESRTRVRNHNNHKLLQV